MPTPPRRAVAIGLEDGAFPLSSPNKLDFTYPPSVLVHFTADKNTDAVRPLGFLLVGSFCGLQAASPCGASAASPCGAPATWGVAVVGILKRRAA